MARIKGPYPLIITIPHASNRVPDRIRPQIALRDEDIYNSWDLGSTELYTNLPVTYTFAGTWSRIVVDLNRSPRADGARGVIPLVDYGGREIYKPGFAPDQQEKEFRLMTYYWPYHREIEEIVSQGKVIGLIDCHTLNGIGPKKAPDFGRRRPDVVLGNNGNSKGEETLELGDITCDPKLMKSMAEILSSFGLSVKINDPYPGGYVTVHYGRRLKKRGGFAFQMELNQDLFADPITGDIQRDKVETIEEILKEFIQRLFRIL